jgi:hypothetical protein
MCNNLIRALAVLKSVTYCLIGTSMKYIRQTSCHTQHICAALVLTSILSLGLGITFVKPAAAESVKNPQDVSSPKQSRNRQLPSSVLNAVRREISRRANIPPGRLKVVTFTQQDWPDSCLGLGKPDQACGQVYIKDGWRVVMSDGRQTWAYRTDGAGNRVRLEEQPDSPIAPSNNDLPSLVAKRILQTASDRTGIRVSELRIVKSEKMMADSCLGLPRPGEACLEYAQETWEVTVAAQKQTLVYRANSDGSEIRLKNGDTDKGEGKLPQSISDAVLKVASEQLGVPSFQLKIAKAEKQTWTDSCLGLPSPTEPCMTRLTPGWRVWVEGKEKSLSYRTDNSGFKVRTEDVAVEPPRKGDLPNSVAKAVLEAAATRSNLSTSQWRIVKAEQREWPDGCLGLAEPDQFCTRAIVPGWHVTVQPNKDVIVQGGQQTLVYRTNTSGSLVKLENGSGLGNSGAVPIPKGELPSPLSKDAIFRVISSGGFAGQTAETTLLNNGQLIRKVITFRDTYSTPDITYVSPQQLQQFKQMLAKQPLDQFNGLSYPAPRGAADYITVTLSSQNSTTRYADMNQDRLPKQLQEVIQAWNQIARSR